MMKPPVSQRSSRSRAKPASDFSDRSLQRSLLRLHAAVELEEVAKAIFKVINAAVSPYGVAVCFQLLEFEKPLIIRLSRDFGYNAADWKRFFEINPGPAYWRAHPGSKFWRTSDTYSDEDWRALDFYREFVEPAGWYYGGTLGFWQGKRFLGIVSNLRTLGQGDFTEAEVKFLLRLHPYLDAAFQRLDQLHSERNARAAAEQLLRRLPLPTVLLDWDLGVIHSNPAGRDSCAWWNFGSEQALMIKSHDEFEVPTAVLEKCRELKTQWHDKMLEHYTLASAAGHPVPHPQRPELRARVHLVQRSTGSVTKPIFRIEFEQMHTESNMAHGNAEKQLAFNPRLTRRERELVALICQGVTNKEIATRLCLSVGTVKKELNTLYQKLEVPSRSRLMALMR